MFRGGYTPHQISSTAQCTRLWQQATAANAAGSGRGRAAAGGGASGWRGWAAAAIAPCQRGRPFNMMLHNNTWYPWHLFNSGKAVPCPPLPSGLALHRTQRSLLSFLFGLFQWPIVTVIATGGLELCSLCTLCTVEAASGACGGPGSSTTHLLGCPKAPLRPARCQQAPPGPLHARHLCIDVPPSPIHYPQPSSVAANPSLLERARRRLRPPYAAATPSDTCPAWACGASNPTRTHHPGPLGERLGAGLNSGGSGNRSGVPEGPPLGVQRPCDSGPVCRGSTTITPGGSRLPKPMAGAGTHGRAASLPGRAGAAVGSHPALQ